MSLFLEDQRANEKQAGRGANPGLFVVLNLANRVSSGQNLIKIDLPANPASP
jgi:hypothetical protein